MCVHCVPPEIVKSTNTILQDTREIMVASCVNWHSDNENIFMVHVKQKQAEIEPFKCCPHWYANSRMSPLIHTDKHVCVCVCVCVCVNSLIHFPSVVTHCAFAIVVF